MAEPTEADREKAMQVMAWDPLTYAEFAKAVHDGGDPDDRDSLEMVDAIAQALADERERARAPFLELADEYDAIWRESTATDPADVLIAGTFRASANDIRRRAAEGAAQ